MSKSTEAETENKTRKISASDKILFTLFIFSFITFIVLFTSGWSSFEERREKAMAEYDAKAEQRIAASELVREFVKDKSVIDVEYEHNREFFNENDAYDFTVTVENSDGQSETKTFKGYCYRVWDSTDTCWHIDISDYGCITIYRPQTYTSK